MDEPIFEIKEERKEDNYTKFEITPLQQGYGQTIGNSLRRVLLTSLPGSAVVTVRIDGVKHQFSSLKGMKEDVVEFILNLKKARFIYNGENFINATLKTEGPREVKVGDIQVDAAVQIANPDLVLANLSEGAKLNANIEIASGSGCSPADDRATGEVGLIPLDASFSPVTRVNYKVEETRVGRLTNYDRLVLEIWTDGTITPSDALTQASRILITYYNQIVNPKKVEADEVVEEDSIGPVGRLSVEEIGLPTRVANALLKAGYDTVEDLMQAKRDELTKVRNLGEKSVKIIDAALEERDLQLGE